MRKSRIIASLVFVVQLLGCGAKSAFRSGKEEAGRENWDAAVAHYQRATSEEPTNVEYRIALRRALFQASRFHAKEARKHLEAEDLEKAMRELEKAVEYDPSYELARAELEEVRQRLREQEPRPSPPVHQRRLLQRPRVLDPSSTTPLHLQFESTSLRKVFEALGKLAGINILFDESFRDKTVTVELADVSFQEALDILVRTNGLFYKVVPSAVLITPDNVPKQ